MKRFLVISIIALSFLLGGIAIAGEKQQEQPNPTGTIVGADLMQNRYEYVDPTEAPKEQPPVVKELLDKGVFTAVQDKQQGGQVVSPKTK